MMPLIVGFAVGVLVAAPLALLASRRTASRVRRLEQRSRASQRLAELGTLTGGLAHEIKNPLSTVGLNAQLLREDLEELSNDPACTDEVRKKLGRIERRFGSMEREVGRLREILEDFLRFAGRVKLDRKPASVNDVVQELVDFYIPQADVAHVQLRTQLDATPDTLAIDADMLKQALLNLVINATQAMVNARDRDEPHGGCDELILQTRLTRDELTIHVIDTGPGIAPDKVEKVFSPYFSTKKGGTGLGLPTARRIIEEHGGTIAFHSEPGRGTDFVVALPTNPPADDAERSA